MENVGLFYGHFKNFTDIWFILNTFGTNLMIWYHLLTLGIFLPFWYFILRKNLATLLQRLHIIRGRTNLQDKHIMYIHIYARLKYPLHTM
jgi:hypothetical protein